MSIMFTAYVRCYMYIEQLHCKKGYRFSRDDSRDDTNQTLPGLE
jgi:hypothetical protein